MAEEVNNIATNPIEEFTTVPSEGKFGDIATTLNNNFSRAHELFMRMDEGNGKNLGFYSSVESLPQEVEDGMCATVVSNGIFTAYIRENSAWVSKGTYTPSAGTYDVITNSEMDSVLS